MKRIKVLLLTAILAVMAISPQIIVNAVSNTDSKKESVVVLKALGIMSGETPETNNITRLELASMMVKLANHEKKEWTEDEIIATAVSSGLIKTFSDNEFEPDYFATGKEINNAIAKLISSANADAVNVVESFYSSRVQFAEDAYVSLENVAYALTELLDEKTVKMELKDGFPSYKLDENTTLLNSLLNVSEVKGLMTSTNTTGLSGYDFSYDTISIDDEKYFCGREYDNLLGMNVIAYISDSGNDNAAVLYMYKNENKNETITILAEDLYDETRLGVYVAEVKGKEKEYKIALGADYIYNGSNGGDIVLSDLKPLNGDVTLIDNNNDGKYDVVKIRDVKSYAVASANIGAEKLFMITGENIDLSEYDYVAYYGVESIADVTKYDIASVIASKDNSCAEVHITRASFGGSVTGMKTDTVLIDGIEYTSLVSLLLGDGGTFYTDMFGKIAYFYSDPSIIGADNYALLKKIYYDETEDTYMVKLFTSNGEFVEYETAKTVRVDGIAYKGDAQVNMEPDIMSLGYGATDINGEPTIIQLIKYTLNNDGMLSRIDTERPDGNANELKLESNLASQRFIGSDGSNNLTGSGYLDDSTKVFVVSKDKMDDDNKGYVCGGPGALKGISSINGKVFDMTDSYSPRAVFAYREGASTPERHNSYMLDEFYEVLNDEDEVVKVMTMYDGEGNKNEFMCAKDVARFEEGETIDALHKGDIISIATDSQQQITSVNVLIYHNELATSVVNNWGDGRYDDEYRHIFGVVTGVGGKHRVKIGILNAGGDVYTEEMIEADTSIAGNVRDQYRTFIYSLEKVNYGRTNFVVYDRTDDEIYVEDESTMQGMIYNKTANPDVRIFLHTGYGDTQKLFLMR